VNPLSVPGEATNTSLNRKEKVRQAASGREDNGVGSPPSFRPSRKRKPTIARHQLQKFVSDAALLAVSPYEYELFREPETRVEAQVSGALGMAHVLKHDVACRKKGRVDALWRLR